MVEETNKQEKVKDTETQTKKIEVKKQTNTSNKKQQTKQTEKTITKEEKTNKPKPTSGNNYREKPRDFNQNRGFRDGGRRDFNRPRVERTPIDLSKYIPKRDDSFSNKKLFGKWGFMEVKVNDISLAKYINLGSITIPHTFGRKTRGKFEKQNLNIVERLVNKLMKSGQGKRKMSGKYVRGRYGCGKKIQAMHTVEDAFTIVESKTNQNPIQVLVKALENSAPREDVTRVKKGGIAYAVAVDVSPMKRLDEAIKNIALATFVNSFKNKKTGAEALAEELIAAGENDMKSASVKRRNEVERIAKASR